jgi:hypothetical protein
MSRFVDRIGGGGGGGGKRRRKNEDYGDDDTGMGGRGGGGYSDSDDDDSDGGGGDFVDRRTEAQIDAETGPTEVIGTIPGESIEDLPEEGTEVYRDKRGVQVDASKIPVLTKILEFMVAVACNEPMSGPERHAFIRAGIEEAETPAKKPSDSDSDSDSGSVQTGSDDEEEEVLEEGCVRVQTEPTEATKDAKKK